jgi:type VI secretion system protein VasG
LTRLARRVQESHDLDVSWDDAVLETIVARCTDVETGARNVDHILRGSVLPLLSSQILSHLGDASAPKALRLTLSPQGSLTLTP